MPDDHCCDAKLALIGEAPGRHEDEDVDGSGFPIHQPFIGPSGWDLKQWWSKVGLRREDFWIDNCYPYRPPGNKLELIPKQEYQDAASDMLNRLRRQPVNVVIPTGNYALRSLLGDSSLHITDWRGSILPWQGRKLIPTIHPAATQRQKILTKLCLADWQRIAAEKDDRSLNIPERRLVIDPSEEELLEWQLSATEYFAQPYSPGNPPPVLSVDVENLTTGSRQLTCVGLSFQPNWSITVSVLKRDYESEEQWQKSVSWIKTMLTQGWPIVGQNFMTDLWKLVQWCSGLRSPLQEAYIWDLIEMFHCLDPNDGGDTSEGSKDELEESSVRVGMLDLGTLTSLYTRQPFYKHLSKSPDRSVRLRYNALDAAIQRELFNIGWEKLNERGLV
jgi:uracil-DNA glycosylase family 4